MQVAANTVVSLHYELSDSTGELIEKTDADRIPARRLRRNFLRVEQTLHGKTAGDTCEVYLQPDDAVRAGTAEEIEHGHVHGAHAHHH